MTAAPPPSSSPGSAEASRKGSRLKIGAGLLLLVVVGALYVSPARSYLTIEHARALVVTLRSLWYGPLLFIAAYALGCVVAMPATIFVVSAGIIWGCQFGGTYSLIGGVIGAGLSFFIGRFIGGGLLTRLGKQGRRVERQLESGGFQSMLILRLVPLVPFPVLNYAGGVARMRFRDFILATLIGAAPSHYIITYSADAIASGSLSAGHAFLRILIAGVLMATLVLLPLALKKRVRGAVMEPEPGVIPGDEL
ncbi:MAG: TVP38/TMEM64 family protein [Acidobacteriota bacterium]